MLAGILTDYFFGFGYMLLAGVAYFIRSWRNLQLAISAPGFLFIFYIWWENIFMYTHAVPYLVINISPMLSQLTLDNSTTELFHKDINLLDRLAVI